MASIKKFAAALPGDSVAAALTCGVAALIPGPKWFGVFLAFCALLLLATAAGRAWRKVNERRLKGDETL